MPPAGGYTTPNPAYAQPNTGDYVVQPSQSDAAAQQPTELQPVLPRTPIQQPAQQPVQQPVQQPAAPHHTGGYPQQGHHTGGFPAQQQYQPNPSGAFPLAQPRPNPTGGFPAQQQFQPNPTGGYPVQQPRPNPTGGYPVQQPRPNPTGGYPMQQPRPNPTGGYPAQQQFQQPPQYGAQPGQPGFQTGGYPQQGYPQQQPTSPSPNHTPQYGVPQQPNPSGGFPLQQPGFTTGGVPVLQAPKIAVAEDAKASRVVYGISGMAFGGIIGTLLGIVNAKLEGIPIVDGTDLILNFGIWSAFAVGVLTFAMPDRFAAGLQRFMPAAPDDPAPNP